jgi:hypothetical protein
VNALAGERELDVLARLVDPPLDRGERHLERVRDLGVREADDVTQEERHLQVDVEVLDRAPDRVDRLEPLERRVDDLEVRRVVDVDDRPRPALDRAKLGENFGRPWKTRRKTSCVRSSASDRSPTRRRT